MNIWRELITYPLYTFFLKPKIMSKTPTFMKSALNTFEYNPTFLTSSDNLSTLVKLRDFYGAAAVIIYAIREDFSASLIRDGDTFGRRETFVQQKNKFVVGNIQKLRLSVSVIGHQYSTCPYTIYIETCYQKVIKRLSNFVSVLLHVFDKGRCNDCKMFYKLDEIHRTSFIPQQNGDFSESFGNRPAYYCIKQLHFFITDVFLAGMETSSITISWALFYMIHNPEIQEKIRKEIDDVVGRERPPRMEDRLTLPYTAATLQEVERLGSIVPLSLARSSDKPFKYQDYVFPKNSFIMFNLYSLHRDPQLWKNPEEFDPTRFIDSDGKVFRPPHLSPFGNGKRSCAGEGLARMEIFLLFSTLLQNFVFEAVNKALPPPEKSPNKVQRSPGDYEIKCIRR
ncbi:Cytochrome P450 2D19 [Nymphon striatum]|nr:Cytochrome P450 2D19 [Nymphon striatum]